MRPAQVSFEQFRSAVESLATTEGRLVASAVIVVLAALAGAVVLPFLLRVAGRALYRLLPTQARVVVDAVTAYLPTTLTAIVVRVSQLVVLFVTGVALLVVWGLVSLAVSLVTFAGLSVPLLGQLGVTLGLLVLAYIGLNALEDAISEFGENAERMTDHQEEILLRLGHIAIIVVVAVGALTLWGLDLSGLLVGAGFLGIVVGLAARQTLGSIIAGFVLMLSRPFAIGDWIQVGDHGGIVTKITIMDTRIKNYDAESIVIPNDVISRQPVTNLSTEDRLRLRVEVGVDYETDIDHAKRVAREAVESVESVSESPAPEVLPTGFGDSAILLELRFWIADPTPRRKWNTTASVVRAVKHRFDEEDITIPFPQRELSERADGFRIRGSTVEMDASDGSEK